MLGAFYTDNGIKTMAWFYSQADHTFKKHDTLITNDAYSGTGGGRNNPLMQKVKDVGPIPVGMYHIDAATNSRHTGPLTLPLRPMQGTDTFGRTAFRIHGDNRTHDASHGCIILGHALRLQISHCHDRTLVVTP